MQFNGQREDFLPKQKKMRLAKSVLQAAKVEMRLRFYPTASRKKYFLSRIFRDARIYFTNPTGYTNKECVRPPHTYPKANRREHVCNKHPCGEVGHSPSRHPRSQA